MYKLRPYQQKAVSDVESALATRKNGIVVMPAGSGKSLIIAEIASRCGGKTVILQPTKEILEQNLAKLQSYGSWDIGVYSASMNEKTIGSITFATIGTIIKKKSAFSNFNRIVVDECHRVNSKGGQYEEFISHLGIPTIGLTATPYRMRNYRDMRTGAFVAESRILTRTRPRIFQQIIHITQLQELFRNGFLSPLDYTCYTDYDSKQIKATSTEQGFDDKALELYNKEKQIPAKIIGEVGKTDREHILIFTPFVSESDAVVEGLRRVGISCGTVSAKTPKHEREDLIDAFRAGEIRCVVNVGVLTTGFDYPELDCIILGRVTKSVALYYQMIGRGVRPYPGKQSCKVIDLTDNVQRFGKIETFELFDRNENGMWRLRSDAGPLTGVDVATGRDLEQIKRKYSQKDKDLAGDLVITFGKYKDQKLKDLPGSYLAWAIENFDNGRWKKVFQDELGRRTNGKD